MKKNLVIVDTIGSLELLHPAFQKRFGFVSSWHAHRPSSLNESMQHPHGGMALEKALCPLWNHDDIAVHFVQIFNSRGQAIEGRLFDGWLMDTLETIRQTGPTWINNSWGAYAPGTSHPGLEWDIQAQHWRTLIGKGDVYVGWAAGNNGDYSPDEDRDYPQSLLTDCSDKVGAANRGGRPSRYSGDSKKAPPIGVYWASDVLLLNPNTGRSDKGSGTSFACPKHVGLMCARGIITREDVTAFRSLAVRPKQIPDEVIPHPKWGASCGSAIPGWSAGGSSGWMTRGLPSPPTPKC